MVITSKRLVRLAVLLGSALAARGPLGADVIIPSTGYSGGAPGPDYRTDVRIYNPTGLPQQVTPIFYRQANLPLGIAALTVTEPTFTILAREQLAFDNIIGVFFGQPRGSYGPVLFKVLAPLVVSSGTNNYNGCGNGSISGQWIPGLDLSLQAQAGELVQLATNPDLSSGYRSNVVFVNPSSSKTATVTATLRRGDGSFLALALFTLGINGFKQINNFKTDFLPAVSTSDTNLWLEFVSDNPVFAYASVINNLSGDPFAVVATPPPLEAAYATIAYYPTNPTAGSTVSFLANAINSPLFYTWTWGDGSPTEIGPTPNPQHTYTTAGTYRVILTVTNYSGGSTIATDVVVN